MSRVSSFCAHKKIIPATQYEPAEVYCDLNWDMCKDCPYQYSEDDYYDSFDEPTYQNFY